MISASQGTAAGLPPSAVPAILDEPVPKPRARRRRRRSDAPWAWLMISPLLLGLSVFFLWPIAQVVYYSFTEWGPFGGHTWTGLGNYRRLVEDRQVRTAVFNTLRYTVLALLGIPLAVVFAAMLNHRGVRGVSFFRALFFLPVVTLPAAVAMVWRYALNGDFGIVNQWLSTIGVHGPAWVSDGRWAPYTLVVVGIWSSLGYNIVILLAGLQTVPRELYEASSLDGAGSLRQFWAITVPLLSPSTFFVSVLTVIGTLQTFDLIYVMIGRTSPALQNTQTIIYVFYERAFDAGGDRGYGAAIVCALLLFVLAITFVQFRLQRRWVHYA